MASRSDLDSAGRNHVVFIALCLIVHCCLSGDTGVAGADLTVEATSDTQRTACNVTRVENYSDVCMCTLTEVLCKDKALQRVPTSIMPMVKILDLSYNKIPRINDTDFIGLENLQVLYLQNNEITLIEPASFKNLFRLQTLILANNKLGALDTAGVLFQSLTSITRIDLQNSEITQLNKMSFMRAVLAKNMEILLGGNKIKCDCNVYAVLKWKNTFTPNKVRLTNLVCDNDPLKRTYDQVDASVYNCQRNGSLTLTSPADTNSTNKNTEDMGNNKKTESRNNYKLNEAYDVKDNDGVDASEISYPLSLVEVTADTGENEIFKPSRPNCTICTNVSIPSLCTEIAPCTMAQSMCYSQLTWDPAKRTMSISKGCLPVTECVNREHQNSKDCTVDYLNNKTIQCHFCCIGPTCVIDDNTLGGRIVNLEYFITYVRDLNFEPYMNQPASSLFLSEQARIANATRWLFTDLQAGMDITVQYKSENNIKHRVYLYVKVSVLSTVTVKEVLQILNDDIEKAKKNPENFFSTEKISPDSFYVGVQNNDQCKEDTTVSDKGNITWIPSYPRVIFMSCPYSSSTNASRECVKDQSFTYWEPVDDTNCSTLAHNWTSSQTRTPGTLESTTPTVTTKSSRSPEVTGDSKSTQTPGKDDTTQTRQTGQTLPPGAETSTQSPGTGTSLETSATGHSQQTPTTGATSASTISGISGQTLGTGPTGQTTGTGLTGQTPGTGTTGNIDPTQTPVPTITTVTDDYTKPSEKSSEISKNLMAEIKNTKDFTPVILNRFVNILETLTTVESLAADSVLGNVMDSINSLLQVDDTMLKRSEVEMDTSKRLLKVIEHVPERAPMMDGELKVITPHLAVAAFAIYENETRNVKLTAVTDSGQDFTEDQIQVGFQGDSSNATTITIPSQALIQSLDTDQRQKLQRVAFTVFQSDKLFSTMNDKKSDPAAVNYGESEEDQLKSATIKINSNVISASIAGIKVQNLSENITMTFQHNYVNSTNPQCVYWKEAMPPIQGGWSDAGCGVIEADNLSTTCGCNHLTNFALLMDVYQEGINLSELDRQILSIISYVGCAISFCALLLTVLTYSCFRPVTQYSFSDQSNSRRKLRRDNPSKILINLCLALLSSNLVFLIGMQDYTFDNTSSCKVVAVLLHYFLLASMTWMAVEAFYMYLALILVFKTYFTNFILKCSLVGWGVPLLIVIITLAVNSTDNYGLLNSGLCWIHNPAFYGAFVGPVCVILLINCMAFGLVVRQLMSMSSTKLNKTDRNSTIQRLRGAVGVVILLGLSWIFAIFAIDQASVVFYYLFAIFNSLQGLFIFIFYCLLKKDAMTAWRRMCPCSEEFGEQSKYSSNSKVKFWRAFSKSKSLASTANHNVVNKGRHSVVTLNGTTTTSTAPDSRKNSYFSTLNSNTLNNSYEEKELIDANTATGTVHFATQPRASLSPHHPLNNGFPAKNDHEQQRQRAVNYVYADDRTEKPGIPKVNNVCVDSSDDLYKQVHNYLNLAHKSPDSPIKEFREVSQQPAEYDDVPEKTESPSLQKRIKAEGEIDTSHIASVQDIKLKFERTFSETSDVDVTKI
ncbi:unnamed protein product [Lymnaea stagnalis]|uniref:Adhesion G-protein coupled receptor G2-like n=1 Tax=Lymnaea stagnalis TaxID=6523 RepID=A0AAV2HYC4_LYMST